jgi:2-polyprenyl-6-methoxyphenol hydroxylase-like FAD-dependent oxidoreductase
MEADGFEIAVIGAGPAGILAAALLRKHGHQVCVLERSRFPRFVIGESLLPSCMGHLEEAGLLPHLTAQGYLRKGGIAILRGETCAEYDFSRQFHDGWSYTWQVKRADFDQAMVDAAEQQGVAVLFEREVTGFEPGARPLLSWKTADGTSHQRRFEFVVDASGYGRVLAKLLALESPSQLPERRTVFSHVRGDIRPAGIQGGYSWAALHEDGWIWVIPFSDGATSVGVVALPEFFARYPDQPDACLRQVLAAEPNLARRMPAPEFVFPPRVLQGWSARVSSLFGDGYCLVGNSGDFLDPIFSSGIALGFAGASRAVAAIERRFAGESVDWQAEFADPVAQGIDVFRDYVNWWYEGTLEKLFFSDAPDTIQRQICSVLAGYVWDPANPFVADRRRKIPQLVRVLRGAS